MISIIEFAIYGLIAYGSLLVLIVSVIKPTAQESSGSIARVIWFVPGIVAAGLLQTMGNTVNLITRGVEFHEVYNGTTGLLITNTTINQASPDHFLLIDPVWTTFNFLVFISLVIFTIIQSFQLLTKT